MTRMSISRRVAAPRERVFAAASDLRNAAGRIRAIVRIVVLTDGPMRVGTRFEETRRMMGREATETMEIVEFDAPRSYTLGGESHGVRFRTQLRFEERDGGTEIVMDSEVEPVTFAARVMTFLTKPLTKAMLKACAKDLDDIAAYVEGRGPAR